MNTKTLSKVKNSLKEVRLNNRKAKISLFLHIILLLSLFYPVFAPQNANASVTEAFVRFDRLMTGSAISGTACLKSSLTTQTGVIITFPLGWTVSGTPGDWTVTTTNLPKDPVGGGAASAWPGIGTATTVTGLSVRFPTTSFVAATFYCFNFAGASSTVGTAGNDKTGELKTTGGSPYTDSVSYATSVVSSGPAADQISVTASVAAQMTFALSGTSTDLGTITTGTTNSSTPTITQTVTTNARNGWTSWVKGTNNGGSGVGALHSTIANADIASPGTYNGTPETLSTSGGYVLDVNTGSGTPTVDAEYDGSTADAGGHIDQDQFRQTATKTTPGASDTVTLVVKARTSATTPAAADYADTLTISAAGSF